MRIPTAALAAVLFVLPLSAIAAETVPAVIITAQQISLYPDRSMTIADGGVAVHAPGLQMTATRIGYDMKTNRLTATGDVKVTDASGTSTGEAYVYDFTAKHGQFVPTAVIPQLPSIELVAIAQQAELRPAQSIAFTNAQVRSGAVFQPEAAYTYTIPPPAAKDFGYSPVPSAALEWPLLLAQKPNGYVFARLRYDKYNGGPGTGLEEHYAKTDRGYAAVGQTLDVNGARFDLGAFQRMNEALTHSLQASSYFGTRTWHYAVNATNRRGFASLSFAQYNATRSDDLLLSGNQRGLGGAGTFRLQTDFGHDIHPADYSGAEDFRVTPALNFNSASVHAGALSLSTSVDLAETVYNYGRGTLSSSQTFWGTLPVTSKLLLSGGATFSHVAPPYPATLRTYTLGQTWRASRAFNLVSSLTYTHDYGQLFGIGRPIFSAAFDARIFRKNGTGVEVGAIVPFGGAGDMNRQAAFNLRFLKQ